MEHLIIFTRYPEAGKTKTRLIPALGAEGAAEFHRLMTEKTVKTVREFAASHSVSVEIRYTGGNLELMQDWLGVDLRYNLQGTGDLGDRLRESFQGALDRGKTAVIAIGTDCLDLSVEILSEAFEKLKPGNIVLGPAEDGGYYLIGLCQLIPELFLGINWGTSEVFQQTLTVCETLNLSVEFLPTLADIDRPEDLK
ncbi:MAG: TIGR04282 family arsenosugar biosynthesis glycosyltransferase [Limnoraphis robusta]|uniref:TIGR04282 family arsenosugar biosynthesis glycosyltransferase n=1 Tax=Limnoraphis robusta CCNP1315 TaxID=3110306 RepID=A0ABU5U194_9CYAN|nr:TIGR04282 family arsenosugar biosynthesis glycosyltransferase [Limnoraphis robusta]MEA5520951.1 TIGR04282 family arsenosugar biosynthesis glycosyltransferase [Limnoraphis robusta CCNP1315]MEA5543656.1 TIGR04282 family arsenosugar biosynthesis glycosyltransferase [Limnoraphis robusta CCNP1324]